MGEAAFVCMKEGATTPGTLFDVTLEVPPPVVWPGECETLRPPCGMAVLLRADFNFDDVCPASGPERHANKFYDITGPQPQSMHEVAADLGEVMGKKVEYLPQDMAQFEKDFGPTRA